MQKVRTMSSLLSSKPLVCMPWGRWKLLIWTGQNFQPMIYEIQGVVITWGDLWRAEMCTNWALPNPYHHSAVKNHLYKIIYTNQLRHYVIQFKWFLGGCDAYWQPLPQPYHPSRYWEPHIQTGWEFYPMLYDAIQRAWITLVDFWAAGVCTDGTPTPTLPPI